MIDTNAKYVVGQQFDEIESRVGDGPEMIGLPIETNTNGIASIVVGMKGRIVRMRAVYGSPAPNTSLRVRFTDDVSGDYDDAVAVGNGTAWGPNIPGEEAILYVNGNATISILNAGSKRRFWLYLWVAQ